MKTLPLTIRRETTWLNPQVPATLLFAPTAPRELGGGALRTERPTARWNRSELLGGVPVNVQR